MLLIPVLNPPTGKRRNKVAKKKTKKKSSSKRRSSVVRTTTRKKGTLTWKEAAWSSGAVYPKTYPRWHEKSGKTLPKDKVGKSMSKFDALRFKRPVVGYLGRQMIREWYDPRTGGATARKGSRRLTAAEKLFLKREGDLKEMRKKRGTPWKRHPEYYKRGKKKGQRKPDFKVTRGKVKFRTGRGPVTTVKVLRGLSPTQRQIDRMVTGGFAGHRSAPGGKMKLNKPRRRRKARKRRTAARTKSGRFKKSARKNPRRRARKKKRKKTRAYNNPHRRKRRRKKSRARKNPHRKNPHRRRKPRRRRKATRKRARRKYKANPRRRRRRSRKRKRKAYGYKANPRRRRKRRKGRKRKYAMRRNPNGILRGMLADLQSVPKWITAGHILIGAGVTAASCSWLLTRGPLARVGFLQQRGFVGSLGRLALCGLAAGGISALGALASRQFGNPKFLRGARTNLLIGGMAYALANFLYEVFPGTAGMLMIPQISAPRPRAALSGLGNGGPDYRYGYGGMGAVIDPETLVAGESLARNVNEFSGMGDWMELSGLGSSGGAPIPMEDLRGYPGQYGGGLNDWVELTANNELVRAGFDPGVEAF